MESERVEAAGTGISIVCVGPTPTALPYLDLDKNIGVWEGGPGGAIGPSRPPLFRAV